MKKVIIGIGVSKLKLDLCVLVGDKISQEIEILSTYSSIKITKKNIGIS